MLVWCENFYKEKSSNREQKSLLGEKGFSFFFFNKVKKENIHVKMEGKIKYERCFKKCKKKRKKIID